MDKDYSIKKYINILNNIVFSDYIDRITFQKQIWLFNEITSLIKTFYNNRILHKEILKDLDTKSDEYFKKKQEIKKLKQDRRLAFKRIWYYQNKIVKPDY